MNVYHEYPPPDGLKFLLECYWSYVADSKPDRSNRKPVIPDGCVDIIFDLDNPPDLQSFVVGAMTKPIVSRRSNLLGVRFKPGMAYPFLKTPLHKLTDLMVDFTEFAGRQANILSGRLLETSSAQRRIAILNETFIKRLPGLSEIEPRFSQALGLIQQSGGGYSVGQISESVGWSRQHLARKFLRYTGLPPKFLTQVLRLKNVITRYKTGRFHDWSQLSLEGGYFDQSHKINEVKKITGLTPTDFLAAG